MEPVELIVCRGWLMAQKTSDETTCLPILRDPIRTHSTDHLSYAGALRGLGHLRHWRPTGLNISGYVLDGAGFWSVLRSMEQYHNAFIEAAYPPGPKQRLAWLTDFVVGFL